MQIENVSYIKKKTNKHAIAFLFPFFLVVVFTCKCIERFHLFNLCTIFLAKISD